MRTDITSIQHICRNEPYSYTDTSIGPIPLYKTLCGIHAILSIQNEEKPTCKNCIRLRGDKVND